MTSPRKSRTRCGPLHLCLVVGAVCAFAVPGRAFSVASDLSLSLLDAPPGPFLPGDTFNVDNDVFNGGPSACSGYTLQIYLLTVSDAPVTSGTLLSNLPRGSITVGFTDRFRSPVTLPANTAPGTYFIGAVVTYSLDPNLANNSLIDITSLTVSGTLDNKLPQALITASQTSGAVGQTLSFDGSASSDPDGVIVDYLWDYGDGTSPDRGTAFVTHSWITPGTFMVSLQVVDDQGAVGNTSVQVFISIGGDTTPPVISVTNGLLSGMLDDPSVAWITVNGLAFPVAGGAFSATAPIGAGQTTYSFSASNSFGTTTRSVEVIPSTGTPVITLF